MQELFSPVHVLILLIVAWAFFRPESKPPVHPLPADDSTLLRRLRIFRNS